MGRIVAPLNSCPQLQPDGLLHIAAPPPAAPQQAERAPRAATPSLAVPQQKGRVSASRAPSKHNSLGPKARLLKRAVTHPKLHKVSEISEIYHWESI